MKTLGCSRCKNSIYGNKCCHIKMKNKFKKGKIIYVDDPPEVYIHQEVVRVPICYKAGGRYFFMEKK